MAISCIVGAQWGDEGKGKVVDILAADSDVVVRYQGGNNAGHTIKIGARSFILHTIPTGILHPAVINIIGPGVVLDLEALRNEISELRHGGVTVTAGNLRISRKTHLVLPYHRSVDVLREAGSKAIGTTKRGIGPAYEDKAARRGIRVGDLEDWNRFRSLLEKNCEDHQRYLRSNGQEPDFSFEAILSRYEVLVAELSPSFCDVEPLLVEAVLAGRKVLLEGAQGVMLDLEHGSYPYVTSSNILPSCGLASLGLARFRLDRIVGVSKGYATRVGAGPFPSEDLGPDGQTLQQVGREFGATTGRKRRCGWLDLVALKYACDLGAISELVLTKMDILGSFETIKIAVEYQDSDIYSVLNRALSPECRYEKFAAGWTLSGRERNYADLPKQLRGYIEYIEDSLNIPVSMISTGADREQILIRQPG